MFSLSLCIPAHRDHAMIISIKTSYGNNKDSGVDRHLVGFVWAGCLARGGAWENAWCV